MLHNLPELIALYGWFHEYIEDNNLDLVDEFEDGKILIYDDGKVIYSLNLEEAKKMKDILSSPGKSYMYAQIVIEGEFKLGEPAIAKDAECSYFYTRETKKRFELGEPVMAKDAQYSEWYKEFLSFVNTMKLFH